jgi:hypothetical protein
MKKLFLTLSLTALLLTSSAAAAFGMAACAGKIAVRNPDGSYSMCTLAAEGNGYCVYEC